MALPIPLQGREVVIGASIGIAFARDEDRVDEVIRNADVAMYRAKDGGKGRHAGGLQSLGSKSILTARGWPIRFKNAPLLPNPKTSARSLGG